MATQGDLLPTCVHMNPPNPMGKLFSQPRMLAKSCSLSGGLGVHTATGQATLRMEKGEMLPEGRQATKTPLGLARLRRGETRKEQSELPQNIGHKAWTPLAKV